MDIRPIAEGYAVTPQIEPADVPAIAAQGFTTVVCNRPDPEVPHELSSAVIRAAVEAAGLRFIDNPMAGGALTMDHITTQRETLDQADGPVLAYCASGNRSTILWALANAGRQPTDDLIAAGARYGYQVPQFRDLIDRLAREG
jgi:uncharacterized protein (TIGR01244 family)